LLVFPGEILSQSARISIVKSALRNEYEQTTKALITTLKSNISVNIEEFLFNTVSDNENFLWEKMTEKRPDLIITVGTPATRSAIKNVQNIPIIFTMVLDQFGSGDSQYISSSQPKVSGITLAIPVKEQLEILNDALPSVRRVGFLYSINSENLYHSARDITNKMGLRLVGYQFSSERDILSALKGILPEIDVFWMPPDVTIYERSILRYILLEYFRNGVPIMAVSKHIAIAGVPLALGIDYEDIGKQTAELALKRLSSNSVSKPIIETPRTVLLYINERVLSRLGITVPRKIFEKTIPVESGR